MEIFPFYQLVSYHIRIDYPAHVDGFGNTAETKLKKLFQRAKNKNEIVTRDK
jgi:hypothetical protein